MNTGMNRRGWSALVSAYWLHGVRGDLQVGDHELVEFDAFNRLQVSSDHCSRNQLTAKRPFPIAHGIGEYRIMMIRGKPLCFMTFPNASHLVPILTFGKNVYTSAPHKMISRIDLTLTDKKAIAAPSIEANDAIRNPGQIP